LKGWVSAEAGVQHRCSSEPGNFVPSETTKLASRVLALLQIKWLTSVDAQTLELPTFVLFFFVVVVLFICSEIEDEDSL